MMIFSTKEELAALLNGRQYTAEISAAEAKRAHDLGLVVAYGASDDLLELEGRISDEFGAYEGTEISFSDSLLPISERDDQHELIEAGWTPPTPAFSVKAEWCVPGEGASWKITTSLPFAPFDIMEDGELFCRGAVFAVQLPTPPVGEA